MSGNEVGRNFKKINILLERGRNHDLKLWGLTGTQMEIMEYLHDRNGEECVLSNIAAFFDVKHTSVLHVVKILEKKGLIGREEKQGGRLRRIYLTAAGKALMQETDRKKSRVDRTMLAGMTEAECMTLQRLLEKIYRNLKAGEMECKHADSERSTGL
ncbi:MAG: MarR family transcriptional regulator [Lachnospiraceae bacterium]|jgi:DNA-binding MarR family transcriptional regulator|nr:MarR family transcriptional regulator [Lachnospiraceae bacterium]